MSRARSITGGLPALPLVVLTLLFFFDEWDTAAFNVLAPNIQHAFHLTDRAFGLLVISNLSVVLLLAVPLGFFGDRLPRVWFVTVGAVVAWLAGWRAAFMVLIVPVLLTAIVSLRLREPVRGATDDPASAEAASREDPVSFGEARRTLFAVPTLRRQFSAFFFIGAGLIPLA